MTRGAGRSNFIRAFVGSTLSAEEILSAGRTIIKVCRPEVASSAGPAIIALPPAARFEGRDLTIIDSAGLGYRMVADGDSK